MSEHKSNINTLKDNYSVPLHFVDVHNGSTSGLRVFGIETISHDLDNGRKHQSLYNREAFWIFTLGSLAPKRLNEEIELQSIF